MTCGWVLYEGLTDEHLDRMIAGSEPPPLCGVRATQREIVGGGAQRLDGPQEIAAFYYCDAHAAELLRTATHPHDLQPLAKGAS